MELTIEQTALKIRTVADNLSAVIRGKQQKNELVVLALVSGGHILIEDIPGVGKTTLARALAKSVTGKFNRIQFTPDLLPTDITGVNIYKQNEGVFQFSPGPIFANILLADEINRASPRTQSAMLEAMSEGHVTMDGRRHHLPSPFIVLATQNPIEYHGTYPLPEGQLDRFMLQIDLGYPPEDKERELIMSRTSQDPVDTIEPVLSLSSLHELQIMVDQIRIEESVSEYLMNIVAATRQHGQLRLGVSTRGALLYARIARAKAMLDGRDYVIPEDIKDLAVPVLAHRILLSANNEQGNALRRDIITDILKTVEVPK